MKLTIFTDETFKDVREVRECARMKIPYRTSKEVIKLIQSMDLKDDEKILHTLLDSEEHVTAIVRATFGLDEEDLAYIDAVELADLGREILGFVVKKMADLGMDAEAFLPNVAALAK